MTSISDLLTQAVELRGLDRLDAEVLLAHLLNRPRSYLYAWPDRQPDPALAATFAELAERCSMGEPVAYLTGSREFWSLNLRVTRDTLIPRPETETLVEQALLRLAPLERAVIADLGTGSGAIAVALSTERPNDRIIATDLSAAALAIARENARNHNLTNIECRQGDWTAALPIGQMFDLLVSNPPYVAEGDPHLTKNGLPWEPVSALTSGGKGLNDITRLASEAPAHLKPGGWLMLEHGLTQGAEVREILRQADFIRVESHLDLEQRERITCAMRPTR